MRYEVTAEFTPSAVRIVARRFVLHLLGAGYFVSVAVLTVVFVYLAANRVNEWTTGAAGAVLALGVIFPVVFWWKTERSGLSRLRRMSSPTVKFVLDDKGITADSELGAATLGWKSIEKIWEFPEAWLLFVGKHQYANVPIAVLTEELKQIIKGEAENCMIFSHRSKS